MVYILLQGFVHGDGGSESEFFRMGQVGCIIPRLRYMYRNNGLLYIQMYTQQQITYQHDQLLCIKKSEGHCLITYNTCNHIKFVLNLTHG
jgi:hypothetical protein